MAHILVSDVTIALGKLCVNPTMTMVKNMAILAIMDVYYSSFFY